jgi:lipid-A-disaccharide synthase
MGCDFVGHPVASRPVPDLAARAAFRDEIGVGDAPLLTILPGSRKGEVRRLAPVFGRALGRLAATCPGLRVAVPVASAVDGLVRRATAEWPVAPVLLDATNPSAEAAETRKLTCFAASDAALAASGTVVLELAAMGCPMVAAYRMNHLTSLVVRRLIRVSSANLVNILVGRPEVPEFLQEYCTDKALAEAVLPLLTDPAARERQRAAEAEAIRLVGRGGPPPAERAAEAVLRAIG